MNDVMKKRLIGVAILVVIGVLAPLLLSRCMHSGSDDDGRGSMRVYNVQPDGEAEPATGSGHDTDEAAADDNTQHASAGDTAQKKQSQQPSPDAVSPQSKSEFSTPPVHGNSGNDEADTEAPSEPASTQQAEPSQQSPGQSEPNERQRNTEREQAGHNSRDYGSSSVGSGASSSNSSPSSNGNSASSASGSGLEKRQPKGWVVQIASFGKQDNAEALVRKLQGQFKAFYTPGDVNGKTWYRVNVGPFDGEDAARSAAGRLKQQGHNTLVRHLP